MLPLQTYVVMNFVCKVLILSTLALTLLASLLSFLFHLLEATGREEKSLMGSSLETSPCENCRMQKKRQRRQNKHRKHFCGPAVGACSCTL